MPILIRTLGGLWIEAGEDRVNVEHISSRRLALLAVLATSRGGILRDALLPLFWPESPEEKARNALNQALFVLRRELPDGSLVTGPGALLRLDATIVVSDVALFTDAIEKDRLEEAAALYGGEFLHGVHVREAEGFNAWREAEALRLSQTHALALEKLAERAEAAGSVVAALRWWKALANVDPGSSRIALRLMSAYVAARDPAGALRHARTHELLLAEEFGVSPDPDVGALAQRIESELSHRAGTPRRLEDYSPATPETPPHAPPTLPGPTVRRPRATVLSSMAAILACSVLVSVWPHVPNDYTLFPRATSLAVMPFRSLVSPDGSVPSWISEGLTDRLIHALSSQPELRIIARTSSAQLDVGGVDIMDIGRRMGVEAILVGSVRADGDEYRATVRLMDAADGEVLWSESFQRHESELLALETELTGAVLTRVLTGSDLEESREPLGATTSEAAHAFMLQALHLINLRRGEDLRRAVEYLDLALREDATYGLAHALKAQAYMLLSTSRELAPQDAAELAMASAHEALQIDERISAAHSALGAAHQALRNRADAERHFQRALTLNPSDALTHSWYGFLLLYTGRAAGAMRELQLAQQLDPLSIGVAANLGWGQYFTRQYAAAAETFGRLLLRDSALFAIHNGRGRALQQLGRWDEAIAHYRRAAEIGGTQQGAAFLAQALARRGMQSEARAIRAELARRDRVDPIATAIADAGLGEIESALAALELAAADRWFGFVQVAVDPVFDSIRHDPRYTRLLESIWRDSVTPP